MRAHNHPANLLRSLARPRLATGALVALALIAAACSNDSASRINAPPSASLSRSGDHGSSSSGGTGSSFTVLARTAVSCSGGSITGNVGTFQAPGELPPGVVTLTTGCVIINGTAHVGDAAAKAAFNGFLTTYAALAPKVGDVCPVITGTLAGQTLSPGVYCVSSEAKTGTLTLAGPASGTWLIKVPSGALTGTNFSVVMAGGAQACNVIWWVDAGTTMTTSAFQGNILSGAAITMTAGTAKGNAWAKEDVTFTEGNVITGCGAASLPFCKLFDDRVSGRGSIKGPSGSKAKFEVSGRFDSKKSAFRGDLDYEDSGLKGKSDDVEAKGTSVTAYIVLDAVTRRIEGTAKVNRVAGFTYQVDVRDNGKRGSNDVFTIRLRNAAGALVYTASGTLRDGNIKLQESHGRVCDHKDGKDWDHHDDEDRGDDDDHGGGGGHHGDDD